MGGVVEVMHSDDGELWAKHSGEWIRFATMLVGPADAEDLLTTAFLAATSSPGWPEVTNRRAYLFRSVANHAHKHRRAYARRLDRELRAVTPEVEPDETSRTEVLVALQRLTTRQRAVVWLTYWLDFAQADVADTLGISQRTVERELEHARTRLKGLLS
jgi:RNA polymerase sigma factor (sigma-70 family)